MGVMDFFVITRLGAYMTGMCVMDTVTVLMDLMKQIVVREVKSVYNAVH